MQHIESYDVDAGNISVIDYDYLIENGGEPDMHLQTLLELEDGPGIYDVHVSIPDCWNGSVSETRRVHARSGKFVLGDACYAFSDKDHQVWSDFLNRTNYLDNMGAGGFQVNTGGDGNFVVRFSIRKVS